MMKFIGLALAFFVFIPVLSVIQAKVQGKYVYFMIISQSFQHRTWCGVKLWPNGLARRSWTYVRLSLRFVWPPICVDLRRLSLTLVKLFTVWPHNTSPHNCNSQVICNMHEIYDFFQLASPLEIRLVIHRTSVRKSRVYELALQRRFSPTSSK